MAADVDILTRLGLTPEALEAALASDGLPLLGRGSRRECREIPGTGLCLKCYRNAAETSGTVAKEIRRCRHDARRNTCCQEYRYYCELRSRLPDYVFAAFPETLGQVYLPTRGWALVESVVRNADGGESIRFSRTYRAADRAEKAELLHAFWLLVGAFAAYGVRFYDPQNIVVQRDADAGFRLRVVDFEPAARTLVPVDSVFPGLVRGKVLRRAARYLRGHLAVKDRYRGLAPALRRGWDAVLAAEGPALGLSRCRPFLENKLVNDIFYEGTFKGEPCIVKCSTRAPESVRNEYAVSRRLAAEAPVCAEALAHWASADGRRALVVTRKLPGPSLTELLARGVGAEQAAALLGDVLVLARALVRAGVVWRDVVPDNVMLDGDGHLRLIDAQFAIVRADFREDPYLRANWKYRTLVFAHHPDMAGRGWNDVAMMLHFTRGFPDTDRVRALRAELRDLSRQAAFPGRYGFWDDVRMRLLLWKVRLRLRFCRNPRKQAALRDRAARAGRFLSRKSGW